MGGLASPCFTGVTMNTKELMSVGTFMAIMFGAVSLVGSIILGDTTQSVMAASAIVSAIAFRRLSK